MLLVLSHSTILLLSWEDLHLQCQHVLSMHSGYNEACDKLHFYYWWSKNCTYLLSDLCYPLSWWAFASYACSILILKYYTSVAGVNLILIDRGLNFWLGMLTVLNVEANNINSVNNKLTNYSFPSSFFFLFLTEF